MNNTRTYTVVKKERQHSFVSDFFMLIKSRLTLMVVFTSLMGFGLVSSLQVNLWQIVVLFLGGFCVAGAANSLNQALEKDFDSQMTRTSVRPVASGRMSVSTAVMIAGFLSLMGITLLAFFNPLTAFLGTLSLMTYAFVYTPLKRFSSVAVFVGAIPGAMPVLIGCVAFEGTISPLALSLFVIQILWQIPHFWSIGFLSFDEYRKAGFQFVPESGGEIQHHVMLQSVICCLILIPSGAIAWFYLDIHLYYLLVYILISAGFSYLSLVFYRQRNRASALKLMFGSLVFLPLVLTVLLFSQM